MPKYNTFKLTDFIGSTQDIQSKLNNKGLNVNLTQASQLKGIFNTAPITPGDASPVAGDLVVCGPESAGQVVRCD